MRTFAKVALGLGGLLGILFLASKTATAAAVSTSGTALSPGASILLLGDSFAVGMTSALQQKARAAGYNFSARTRTGSTARQWEAALPALLAQLQPNLVIVSLGTNDIAAADDAGQVPHLQKIVEEIHASGARVLWILPPSLPDRFLDEGIRNAILNLPVEGLFDSKMENLPTPRAADGIHTTPQGYAQWADAVWSAAANDGFVSAA